MNDFERLIYDGLTKDTSWIQGHASGVNVTKLVSVVAKILQREYDFDEGA